MPHLEKLTVRELFERASSTAPSPGGGAVAAVGGMLGISLILKALRISLRNAEDAGAYARDDAALTDLALRLAEDADADEGAFAAYVNAARLPKGTEDERGARNAALRKAAIGATDAGIEMLRHAQEAFAVSRRVEAAIKRNIEADLVAGREFLKVVRTVAVENCRANLSALRDSPEGDRLERLVALHSEAPAFE